MTSKISAVFLSVQFMLDVSSLGIFVGGLFDAGVYH